MQVLGQITTLIYTSRVNYVYCQEFLFFKIGISFGRK